MDAKRLARVGEGMAKVVVWLGIATALTGLVFFALAGTYSRYWADDYCYSATIKQLGLLNGLVDWYRHSGNRLSTLFAVALSDLAGWNSVRFITASVLALWAGAWFFCLYQLRRLLNLKIAWPWLALASLVQVYDAALLAPDRLQTIYWRMGTFHYTLPMPLLLINLGLLLACYRRSSGRCGWAMVAGGLLGLFAAGFSETFAALQAGIFATGLLAAWAFLRGSQRGRAIRLLAGPLAGTLLTMLIMLRAPANAWRQAVLPPPDNLLLIIPYALRYAADFILYTLRGQVTPFFVFGLGMGALGLLAAARMPSAAAPRGLLIGAAAALLVMYAWIVCSFAPSAYAGLAYPAGRALAPGGAVLLTGLGCAAFLLGAAFRRWMPGAGQVWLAAAALVLLALVSLYPLRGVTSARRDMTGLSVKAARWDARHAQILATAASGQVDVRVQQTDVVQGLEDIGPDAGNWVNACAAVDYGVRSITANP